MRIKIVTDQHHNDFWAIYECEHCKKTRKGTGYNDAHFHENVIPKMSCKYCGKKRDGECDD